MTNENDTKQAFRLYEIAKRAIFGRGFYTSEKELALLKEIEELKATLKSPPSSTGLEHSTSNGEVAGSIPAGEAKALERLVSLGKKLQEGETYRDSCPTGSEVLSRQCADIRYIKAEIQEIIQALQSQGHMNQGWQ